MSVLGVGIDTVDTLAFARQLAEPFSAFAEQTFTAGERRAARTGPGEEAVRLAARYAAKEALVKAWSGARAGSPPMRGAVDLREIEVVSDDWGRPALRLHGDVAGAFAELAMQKGTGPLQTFVSLTHDGPSAAAVVVLQRG